jgi:hypothetical protein
MIGLSNLNADVGSLAAGSTTASDAASLLGAISNLVLPSTDAGKYQMILNAGQPGTSLRLNAGLAQAFVNQTYVNAGPGASYVNTMSREFYNQNYASPDSLFRPNPGTQVVDTFGDVINDTIGKNVAILATLGHAHYQQGATVGEFTDVNNATTGLIWRTQGAYINTANASAIAQSWNNNINFTSNALIVAQSCNLGNWTAMDNNGTGTSIAQTIADTTGHFVLTPGGYASGQFAVPGPGQNFGAPPQTSVFYGTPAHDYYGSNTSVYAAGMAGKVYNSMRNTYYLSFPNARQ